MSAAANRTKALRDKDDAGLAEELTGLYREGFALRMQRGSGQDVKPHDFKRVRRDIARIKTIMNEKKRASGAA